MKGLILAALLITSPAHALMISGDTRFSVTVTDRPDIIGTGWFVLERNKLTDFEFSVLGHVFTEEDMTRDCQCVVFDGFGIGGIFLEGTFGLLTWHFPDGNFGVQFLAGEDWFGGTSENGQVTGAFSDFRLFTVPESDSLWLLLLGLVGLAFVPIIRRLSGRAL